MSEINLTIPFEADAIRDAGIKLTNIALALGAQQMETTEVSTLQTTDGSTAQTTDVQTTQTTEVQTTGIAEVDDTGVPWDERIHSGAKTRTKNGTGSWKKRKGVDPALFAQVTAELLAGVTQEQPVAETPTETQEDPNQVFGAQTQAQQTPAPTQQTPAPAPTQQGTGTFTHAELMQKATAAMAQNLININDVKNILAQYPGINGVPAEHLGALAAPEYAECIAPVGVAMSQHVILCGGTW